MQGDEGVAHMSAPRSTESRAFQGVIGTTIAESVPWWPAERKPADRAPNVVVVVFDDTGWSDFGCFGSEIATPTVDRLAGGGLRHNSFHVTPLCSPTRACLLTGRNHHRVGMRFLAVADTGYPNCRARIEDGTPTLPGILRDAGYGTYLVGKWHLAPQHEITPAGPYRSWPLSLGFDRYYGFMTGASDQHAPEIYRDNSPVTVNADGDDSYHLSADLVDQSIGLLRDHLSFRPDAPFFLELAFGATHAPFQAPAEYIDKYEATFASGWDETRRARLQRQIDQGIVPAGTQLTEADPEVPRWRDLSEDERRVAARLQAVYAGFLEYTDVQLGRLVDWLEERSLLDDTIIVVLSDNGAAGDGGRIGATSVVAPYNGYRRAADDEVDGLATAGGANGPAHYATGWAMAGNTPFRLYKQYVDLGGIRSPLIVHWPSGIGARGEVLTGFSHVTDIAPTIVEAALGASGAIPEEGVSPADLDFDGISLLANILGGEPGASTGERTQYFEMVGHRAIWHNGWKAVTRHIPGRPYEDDVWRLYDTSSDFAEAADVADRHPDILEDLKDQWTVEAQRNGVFPLDDRPLKQMLRIRSAARHSRASWRLYPDTSHMPFATGATGTDRSARLRVELVARRPADEGVLVASGTSYGGYVLYILDGKLCYEHLLLGERTTCFSPDLVGTGDLVVGFDLDTEEDRSARVRLVVDSEEVAEALIPATASQPAFFGLDVGRDPVSRVSDVYRARGDFPYPAGQIKVVTLDFVAPGVDDAMLAAQIEAMQ